MITPIRPDTFTHIQLNAGAFMPKLKYSDATDNKTLRALITAAMKADAKTATLGATRGGGTFTLAPTIRNIEADGKRGEFFDRETKSSSTVNDGYTATIAGTLLEFREGTLTALGGVIVPDENKPYVKHIKFPNGINDSIESLVWVSDLGGNRTLLIDVKNAINTAGITFTFTDKGEGTLPFTFTAHQADVNDVEYAPVDMFIFEDAPAA